MTGQGPRESNERLEFLGDSVLGLVTSESLYRQYPNEHEGHLTKIKSLLVSKAILSRRALAMGLGRFVLMSHSEVESGGRQRLSILADAFEAVLGAIYLDQGFETARQFIDHWLLRDSRAITSDERHVNYKSHLQEYVQSTYHTHPVYRIRSEYGPDHSKHFNVDVMVGRRVLGSGKGRNKKEAEQAAARSALDQAGALPRMDEHDTRSEIEDAGDASSETRWGRGAEAIEDREEIIDESDSDDTDESEGRRSRRRGRRGGRGRRARTDEPAEAHRESAPTARADEPEPRGWSRPPELRPEARPEPRVEPRRAAPPRPWRRADDEFEEIGRPEGPLEERHVDPYDWEERNAALDPEPARPEPAPAEDLDLEHEEIAPQAGPDFEPIEDQRPDEEFEEAADAPAPLGRVESAPPPAPAVTAPVERPKPEPQFGRRSSRQRRGR